MKTLLVFASTHHGNTKKVVERMAQVLSADMADITRNSTPDLSGYDLVGLASGVYFNTLHKDIVRLAEQGRFHQLLRRSPQKASGAGNPRSGLFPVQGV